jgi:mitotic spindle assembly checkpoint protein MAD1
MKDNPVQEWVDLRESALQALRDENAALLKRLKGLEESGARAGAAGPHDEELVPRASYELVSKEKEQMEEEIRQKEKRLLRLQQVGKRVKTRLFLFLIP